MARDGRLEALKEQQKKEAETVCRRCRETGFRKRRCQYCGVRIDRKVRRVGGIR